MKEQSRRGNKITWVVVCCILVFIAIAAVNFWKVKHRKAVSVTETQKVPVQVYTVKKGEMDWFLEVTGDLRPIEEVMIFPKVPGKVIKRILVDKGDWVDKGQLVASLEKDHILAQLNRAKAQVELAQANLVVLQKDYRRIKNLHDQKAAPKQRLDHIQAELKVARAQLKQAKAALKELKVLYRDHDIYATLSGIVAARYVDPGSFSSTGSPILRISNEKILKVETTIPEKDFPHVRKGTEVKFWVDAYPGKTFTGKVALVFPTLDPKTRTAKVEIHVPNQDLLLRSGMFTHVRLYFGKKQAIIIPRDGLNKMPGTGSYYVYVVRNGKARLRNIKVGLKQGNQVEVLSGLALGEQVVVKGQMRLKDGSTIQVVDESPSKTVKS